MDHSWISESFLGSISSSILGGILPLYAWDAMTSVRAMFV